MKNKKEKILKSSTMYCICGKCKRHEEESHSGLIAMRMISNRRKKIPKNIHIQVLKVFLLINIFFLPSFFFYLKKVDTGDGIKWVYVYTFSTAWKLNTKKSREAEKSSLQDTNGDLFVINVNGWMRCDEK